MPPGMSSKCRSSDGDSSWCVGWISCGGRRQVGRQASTPRGRVAEGIRRGRQGGGRAQCRCQGGCAAHVVGADRHAEERDHADAAVLDLNHAPPVQSSLVSAQAQRIPHLALRRAAEDRVVDAANQILNRHAHRRARGRARAQGRALESSRRVDQRQHLPARLGGGRRVTVPSAGRPGILCRPGGCLGTAVHGRLPQQTVARAAAAAIGAG